MSTSAFHTPTSSDIQETISHVLSGLKKTETEEIKLRIKADFERLFEAIEVDARMTQIIFSFKAHRILSRKDKTEFKQHLKRKLGMPESNDFIAKEANKDLVAMNKRIRELYATKWWKKDAQEMMRLAANIIEAVIREYSEDEDASKSESDSNVAVMDKKSKKKEKKEKWQEDGDDIFNADNFIDQEDSYSLKIIVTLFQSYIAFITDEVEWKTFKKLMKKEKYRKKWNLMYSVMPSIKKLFALKMFMDALDAEFNDFFDDLQNIINSMDSYAMQLK
jgi:hypothetical protein